MIMQTAPKIRGIKEAIQELRIIDPHTAVTEHSLRMAVKSGALPCRYAGRKVLISMETLFAYLNGVDTRADLEETDRQTIINHIRNAR